MNLDDFQITAHENTIAISADPDSIRCLRLALCAINDILKIAEIKARAVRSIERAKNDAARIAARSNFEKTAVDIYTLYEKHLNNGCSGDRKMAMKCIRQELGLKAVDARIYIREGRQAFKTRRAA